MTSGLQPRVLTLSLSSELAHPGPELSDAQLQHRKYLDFLGAEHIVVKTPPDGSREPVEFGPGLRSYPTASTSRYSFIRDAWTLARRVLASESIDLISAQEPFGTGALGLVLAHQYRKPLLVHNVCDFIDNPRWLHEEPINRLLNPLGKRVLAASNAVRTDNEEERQKMLALGIPAERVFNVPFLLEGVDTFRPVDRPSELRAELSSYGKWSHLLLMVARLEDQKDFPTALRAMRALTGKGVRLVLVGAGKREVQLRSVATELELGDSVLFAGWVDYKRLPEYYRAVDLFVLSSIYETSPRVLALAAVAGLPIVSTKVSGVTDFVREGENGYVVPPGDDAALAHGICTLLRDDARRAAFGRRSSELAEGLTSQDRILTKMAEMYRFAARGR